MQNNAEENDYTFLIPFHSLQLTILKSMFSSVLDVSPHHFCFPIHNGRHPESSFGVLVLFLNCILKGP